MSMVKQSIKYSLLASLLLFIGLSQAATYTVGGPNGGWDIMTDQKTWASSQTFVAGDKLAFQYSANHDVAEVTKTEYDSCQSTSPIQKYTGGSTVIPLSAPGKRYFICSTPGHCSAGMKLEVNTLAGSSTPVPAPEPVPATRPQLAPPTVYGPALAPGPVSSGFGPTPSPSPSPVVPAPQSGSDLSPSPFPSPSKSSSIIPSASTTNPDIPATDDPTGSTRTSTDPTSSSANSVALVKGFGVVVAVLLAL